MTRVLLAALFVVVSEGATPQIYDQPPSTLMGCTCAGPCTTSLLFECDVAPVCAVKERNCRDGPAHWSFTKGYYDWCTYEPYQSYEQRTALEKKAIVLAHVNKDMDSGKYPAVLKVLTGIMGESVMVSFDASADVFPEKRAKYIHSVGVTGGISFESTGDHPYSGLFKGAEHGIIRMSSAKAPSSRIAPGMGIKFFRDGRPSANFVAMYSLDGQACSETNFFAHEWKNHIENSDNFGLKLIAAKFWQASYCPLMVGLSDLASGADGSVGAFPFQLSFHALVASECDCTNYAKCLQNLMKIPVGTKLFEVRATASPNNVSLAIGHITLTDALTTSKFGDEELFFKHQHMEADFEIKPEWLKSINRKQECGMGCTGLKPPPIGKGCSSPFNNTAALKMLEDDVVV